MKIVMTCQGGIFSLTTRTTISTSIWTLTYRENGKGRNDSFGMSNYAYRLRFELYPRPPQANIRRGTPEITWVPVSGADIFHAPLPAHKTSKWSRDSFSRIHSRHASSDSSAERPPSRSGPGFAGSHDTHWDALLLPERNVALKETASPALSPAKPSSDLAVKDWRFGPISIDSVDMESKSTETDSRARGKSLTHAKGSSGGLHTKGIYLPSDLKTTDVGWGIVHLYKDVQETLGTELEQIEKRHATQSGQEFDIDKCTTLCILAVPSWMMPSDLLGFVGDQAREDVSHFRLVRTGRANKYMVLLKFRQAKRAREWQKAWNGRLFSAMEVCMPGRSLRCCIY